DVYKRQGDYETTKYNIYGQEEWVQRYNSPHDGWDEATAIAIDNLNNIYVTGKSSSISRVYGMMYPVFTRSIYDIVTIKYQDAPSLWMPKKSLPSRVADKFVKDGGALVGVGGGKDENAVYAFRGNNSHEFYKYIIESDSWVRMESIPFGYKPDGVTLNNKFIGKGASLCFDGDSLIYATRGNSTFEFWAYNILRNRWTQKKSVTSAKVLKGGTSIVYKDNAVYLLAGSQAVGADNFFKYTPSTNSWTALPKAIITPDNKPFKDGSCLAVYDTLIYALKGGGAHNYLYAFDGTDWSEKETIPLVHSMLGRAKTKVKDGGAMTTDGNVIYAIKGGGKQDFWEYSPEDDEWTATHYILTLNKKSVPKTGAALAYADDKVYLLKGNNTNEFWHYLPPSKSKAKVQKMGSGVISSLMAEPSRINNLTIVQNQPEPFSSYTTIQYSVPNNTIVSLVIYDVSGKEIKTLVNEHKSPGNYSVIWNGTDDNGRKVGQGVYFYVLHADGNTLQRKMLMIR
ncbi:MAG: T9SS type A sorting domain-containing protein, partial [candidate division WOR-3 bacterium]|nr:T9SS type A sorting domain-containing protein [candidate division WOR-3 bacterium]